MIIKAKAPKLTDDIYFVGTLDWDRREYHGYTLNGTSYNAFLVFSDDNKAVLIDNVYPEKMYIAQMWGRIQDAFEDRGLDEVKIDYIIQNHVEKDHSGALTEIHQKFPDAPIYSTDVAKPGLIKHYPELADATFITVATGDSLELEGKTFTFMDAKMLHWPDSMFTFLNEEGILFSNDAFGQHLCKRERYDYEVPESELMDAAQKFYANLLTPLTPLLKNKLNEVVEIGLLDKIKTIAPSHGQVWTDPMKIIGAYLDWANGVCKVDQATLIYDTMHFSTEYMAHAIAEGIMSKGVDVKMHFLKEDERSEIVKDVLESKAVLMGVPTLFNKVFPSIADVYLYIDELQFDRTGLKRLGATFGSYGWSGNGPAWLNGKMEEAGFDMVGNMEVNYVPDDDDLAACFDFGAEIGEKIKEL
ncbi:nitric oxide reductase [Methanosphaera cuniculi]|uniref:Nitric oxide reductase n=1 Tax=Methanosphaera cuniculi TaxID=1077256 RepID=A0A2V2BSZ0_9EURY|nr:nitric oxide reductase [Methanosphaera cuniculi]